MTDQFINDFNRDVIALTIKKFIKYKIFELGIIPLSLLIIWQLPIYAGKLSYNILTNIFSFETSKKYFNPSWTGSSGDFWCLGLLSMLIFGLFIGVNLYVAFNNAKYDKRKEYEPRAKKEGYEYSFFSEKWFECEKPKRKNNRRMKK